LGQEDHDGADAFERAARAILTTDTRIKVDVTRVNVLFTVTDKNNLFAMVKFYREALQRDPNLAIARLALAKLENSKDEMQATR
jgi:hypothetical protein